MAVKHGNLSINSENIFPIIKKWCDTHCHTFNEPSISQQPEMRKIQTLYQNDH